MHQLKTSQRIRRISSIVDSWFLRVGDKIARFLIEYRYLIAVLFIGFIVWAIVFNVAVIDYIDTNNWRTRTAWLGPIPGPGTIQLFGFTIEYQLEGYSDYSFYYVHWGYNSLYGVMPYSPEYGILELNGITNENGAHMFPPFTSYLYALGIALGNTLGWTNWGIGLLIAAFGYLTALPIYGIASELSSNKRVGEAAALTYLLNPLMIYHTDYLWFNPAPFVFLFFAGFYMLVRGKRLTGTLLIVSAALFKQTAWFLGIPLVVYLLVRPRERKTVDAEPSQVDEIQTKNDEKTGDSIEKVRSTLQPFIDYFDLPNFMVSVVLVLVFVGAVMFPFIITQPHFLDYWKLALGSFSFEGNFTEPPAYNMPMRIQVLAILAGNAEFAELLDTILISGGPLGFGVILCAGLMVLKDRYIGEEITYLRRILFITLIMMLIVTLFGPRGVFKYYFVMLMPFFSIFSSARMIRGTGEHVPFSASMIWVPITLTLLILIPDRNIYLGFVLLIFLGYLLAPAIDRLYHYTKSPFRFIKRIIQRITEISFKFLTLVELPFDVTRKRYISNIITQSLLLGFGIFFIAFGWLTTQMAVGVDIVTGLEVVLVFSASIVVGFQLLSLAISLALNTEIRLMYLNKCIRELSIIIAAIIWIFGVRTYFLSWLIDFALERQLLVFSSVFTSIWSISLFMDQSNRVRILTDIMLLAGLAIGFLVWSSLANFTLFLLGSIAICTVFIHLILILVHYFDKTAATHSGTINPPELTI
ncbi:MAG: glycosyltransferase family protein [Candidatus Thorarchaeota archaeon SMTZ1-45]|nr:MAG: hypothetical protein AM325_02240 [Candidatus Thorarchaeota archaeon SMTZ1-45]